MKFLDLSDDAEWKRRYRAWNVISARVAPRAPRSGLAVTNRSGVYQLYAWDVENGELHQRTDRPTGHVFGEISPDGAAIYYLDDDGGNEIGHLVRLPFEGGDAVDITPDLDPYTPAGVGVSDDGTTFGFLAATRDGFRLRVGVPDGSAPWRELFHSTSLTRGVVLSANGAIAATACTERSGTTDTSVVAIDVGSGEQLGELCEDKVSLSPVKFAPTEGDERVLLTTNASGVTRPLLWNPRSVEQDELELGGLEGDVLPLDWSPDARRLLLLQIHEAVHRLHVYDIDGGSAKRLDHLPGTVSDACFSPRGSIFASLQDSTKPARLVELDEETGYELAEVLRGGDAPPAPSWRSVSFSSSNDSRIQGWLAVPEGSGPFPTILETHGGPTAVMTEAYSPSAAMWHDHGFAYLTINYRGSTTFGKEFEEAIRGDLGHWEVDDLAAAHTFLVDSDIAEPGRILLTGWSYGGYLTLLGLGKRPELWAGGMAGIAIADWVLMFEDQNETLRGYQAALFGGTPDELPEQHRASSPITYAEDVVAPVLVIQGRNDTRCPARQFEGYERRLLELGKPIEVEWFEAGHGSYATEQNIKHRERMLRFAYGVLSES